MPLNVQLILNGLPLSGGGGDRIFPLLHGLALFFPPMLAWNPSLSSSLPLYFFLLLLLEVFEFDNGWRERGGEGGVWGMGFAKFEFAIWKPNTFL